MHPLAPGDPSSVGPYRLLGRLGAGGMGEVFLGRSPNGRAAAIKLVHADLAADPEFRRRFQREVAAAQRVSGQWTAPVLDSDTESAVPWVATGYVPGPSLHHVVNTLHGPLPEDSVWPLANWLAQALTDIHRNGLIHRDLKPSNVLVTLEGPKVIDFGIARAVDASLATRTGSLIGSPGYMPPEQIRGEQLTGAADVFAFGAVLVFAATGTAPYAADQPAIHTVLYRVVHEEPELGPLSGPLRELAARCLAKDPADRPTLEEVAEIAAGQGSGAMDVDSGLWLPPTLTAQLGRDAASLLALDGPLPTQLTPATPPPAVLPPAPPTVPSAPPLADAPTVTAPASGTAPASPARRHRVLGAAFSAVVVVVALVLLIVRLFDGGGPEADGAAPSQTAGPGSSSSPDAPPEGEDGESGGETEQEAPLHDLLPPDVQEAGEITVHTLDYNYGLSHFDSSGEPAGFEPDLAAALGEQLGIEFNLTQFRGLRRDLLRRMYELSLGGMDPGIGMALLRDTPEEWENDQLVFVNHFQEGYVLMVPTQDAEAVTSLTDLCGQTVATWDAPEMADVVATQSDSANCATPISSTGYTSPEDMADAVRSGRAEAVLLLYSEAVSYLDEAEDSGLVMAGEQMDVFYGGIAVPVWNTQLRDALQQALQTLIDDGTYSEILAAWNVPELAVDSVTVNAGR